jgi:hypothetical protein
MFIVDDCVKEEKREKKLCTKTDANESMSFSKNKEIVIGEKQPLENFYNNANFNFNLKLRLNFNFNF